MAKKTININKTITIESAVFMHIASIVEGTDVSFSEEMNKLCRDGMKARKAQEPQAAGGSDDGGE